MFGRGWESGQATIVAVRFVTTGFASSGSRAEFVADVQPEGGVTAFRATFKGPLKHMNFRDPDVGQVVRVRFHAKSGEVKIDTSDPGVRRDAAEEREEEEFDAIARAAPDSAVPSQAAGPTVQSALTEVSAAVAGLSATTADVSETIAAIKRARASGDLDEVDRLKAEFKRRSDEKPGSS